MQSWLTREWGPSTKLALHSAPSQDAPNLSECLHLMATVAVSQRRSPTQSGSGWSLFGSGIRPSNSSDSENEATHSAKSSGSGRSPVPSRSPSIHIPVIFPDFAGNGELADVGDVGLYSSALSTSPTSAIQARDWLAAQPVDLARLKQWDRLREQLALAAPSADLPVSSSSPLQPSALPLPPSAAASAPSAAAPSSSAAAGERTGVSAAHPPRRRPSAVLVDHRDSVGRTALHYAAGYGQADAVRALVRHGASVDAPDRFGVTPLHWACLKAQASVVEALLAAHADTLLTACAGVFSGKSALDLASAESHSAEVSEALTSALGAALFEQADCIPHQTDCLLHQADCLPHQARLSSSNVRFSAAVVSVQSSRPCAAIRSSRSRSRRCASGRSRPLPRAA